MKDKDTKISVLPCDILLPGAAKPDRFAKIEAANPEMTDKSIAVHSGYSPNTDTSQIKRSKGYRLALQTIQEQREVLSLKPGFRFADVAGRMQKICFDNITHDYYTEKDKNGKRTKIKERVPVSPTVQVAAGKELKEIMGHIAPVKVEMESRTLFASFTNLSGKDLIAMKEHYAGNRVESPEYAQ